MTVPKLGDITGIWNTIREINVADIREEAEQPITIAILGEREVRSPLVRALRGEPGRFGLLQDGRQALIELDLSGPRTWQPDLRDVPVMILVVDGNQPPEDLEHIVDKLSLVPAPLLVVCVGTSQLPVDSDGRARDLGPARTIFLPTATAEEIANRLAPEVIELLPIEQRIAAARRIPGLRENVVRRLVNDTSFSNATYALTSALPELVPLLNIPLNAADVLVLTKNQALLVYKIGLAYGAPSDFQAQMREIMPVIGGGFVWRQMARQLVGLVPGFGLLPKVAVAYAGTYATGQAAVLWYSRGEMLSRKALTTLYKEAMQIGRQRASDLLARLPHRQDEPKSASPDENGHARGVRQRLRRLLPGRSEPPVPPQK